MDDVRDFLEPDNVLLSLLLLGTLLLWTRWGRWGRIFITTAAVLALATGVLPLAGWATSILENRYAAINPPHTVDGIVVLGGALVPYLTRERHQPTVNDAAERLFALTQLQRLYPNAKIVYCGAEDSDAARELLGSIGVDTNRILFD